jgi:sulfite exporter TauE/SafE
MSEVTAAVTLSAAFMAGIAGSAHCLVMCGGLAGALSMRDRGTAPLYHAGRLTGYSLAGVLVGSSGASLQSALNIPLFASTMRVAAALLVILAGVRVLSGLNGLAWIERLGARFWKVLQPVARQAATGRGVNRSLLLGFLWGWLPCGLVYSMLLLAALSGSALRGTGIMLAFGAGTLPAMIAGSMLGTRAHSWLQLRGRRQWSGAILLLFGVWLAGAALAPVNHAMHGSHSHIAAGFRD